jgi:NitT/TauT family transport system substrate-binding protein
MSSAMTTRRALTGAALGVLIALTGCAAPAPPATTGTASGAPTGGQVAVRVVLPGATNFTVGVPYFVAQAKGFFAKHGVTTTPTFTSGGGTNVQAVIGGNADIGVDTGLGAIFAAYANGAKLTIVGACTTGLDTNFLSLGTSSYRTLADLAGTKVGFSSPGSSSAVAVDQINAKLRELGKPQVQPQAIGAPADQLTAVQTGQIAAGFAPPPTFLDRVDSGQLHLVVEGLRDFPAYQNVVSRAIFVDSGFASRSPDAVRGFLAAWVEAWRWAFANQDEAVSLFKKGSNAQDAAPTLKKAFSSYSVESQRIAPISGVDRAMADAVGAKVLKQPLTATQLSSLVDTRYAP